MRKTKFRFLFLVAFVLVPILWSADGTIHTWTGKGSRRDTVEMTLVEPTVGSAANLLPGTNNANSLGSSSYYWANVYTYDMTLADDLTVSDDARIVGDLASGTASVAHSTTASTGHYFTALLMGTTACVEGSLLVGATATGGTSEGVVVKLADNVADLTSWVGIAQSAVSTGSVVNVYVGGFVLARTTGTVTTGQTLVSSSVSEGYLAADATPTTGADVGVALEAGTAAGGLTLIRLR